MAGIFECSELLGKITSYLNRNLVPQKLNPNLMKKESKKDKDKFKLSYDVVVGSGGVANMSGEEDNEDNTKTNMIIFCENIIDMPINCNDLFKGWSNLKNLDFSNADFSKVTSDLEVNAIFEEIPDTSTYYTVEFVVNGVTINTQQVKEGEAAVLPEQPAPVEPTTPVENPTVELAFPFFFPLFPFISSSLFFCSSFSFISDFFVFFLSGFLDCSSFISA